LYRKARRMHRIVELADRRINQRIEKVCHGKRGAPDQPA
jgi:hypothetical protein